MNESANTSSFNSRITSAAKIIKQYISETQENLDAEGTLKRVLFNMGIDDADMGLETLDSPTTIFEDFHQAVNTVLTEVKIPLPRLKLAWTFLQLPKEASISEHVSPSVNDIIKTIRPIGQWSDLELLEGYGKDSHIDIEQTLKSRSKDRNCIVFFEDGTVDIENSLYMLRKARYQMTSSTFMFNGIMKQLYKVGEFPLDVLYECPIHSNVLLIDGYCEECGLSHDTQNTLRLSFLRLTRTMSPNTEPRLYRDMNFDTLCKEFPKIFIEFKQLKYEDKLPSLKRRISKTPQNNDPFRVHRSY